MRSGFGRTLRRLAGTAALAAAIGGCAPTIDNRGHVLDPDAVSSLQPGVQTRDDVTALLGSPSAVSTFDPNTWYYVSRRTETLAFWQPRLIEQRVLAVSFDDRGRVREVRELTTEDARTVELVNRETPTAGREMTILEQLFGNLGRFNPDNQMGR